MDKKPRILFVDDEDNIRLLYKTAFEKEGYDVLLAKSGEEALQILEKDKDIDLIVLDIKMKGMSGLDTLQKIVKEELKIPVILSTAYVSYQEDYMSWFADAYVVKQADLTELKNEIKRLLKEKRK